MGGGSAVTSGGDGSSAKATEGSAPVRGCYGCGKKGHTTTRKRDARRDRACTAERTSRQQQQQQQRRDREKIRCEYVVC